MDQLNLNLAESEKTVEFLRQQITILTALAAQKKDGGATEEKEIKSLTAENELLRTDVLKLKQTLQFYEVQNGVVQIKIPQGKVEGVQKSLKQNL